MINKEHIFIVSRKDKLPELESEERLIFHELLKKSFKYHGVLNIENANTSYQVNAKNNEHVLLMKYNVNSLKLMYKTIEIDHFIYELKYDHSQIISKLSLMWFNMFISYFEPFTYLHIYADSIDSPVKMETDNMIGFIAPEL